MEAYEIDDLEKKSYIPARTEFPTVQKRRDNNDGRLGN